MTRFLPLAMIGFSLLSTVGCNGGAPTRTQAEMDRGKLAVNTVLEAWKKGEPTDKLKLGADPITFSEDFRRTHTLVEFTVGAATVPDPRTIQYAVVLKLKDKKGKLEDRDVMYLIELNNPIRVSRDPYN